MKKIVLNRNYGGGFGLSKKAIIKLMESINKECYFYHFCFTEDAYVLTENIEKETLYDSYCLTKYHGELIHKTKFPKEDCFPVEEFFNRDDPRLIGVVEELGKEAGTMYASLDIVEVPDDFEWKIIEDDGFEHLIAKDTIIY